MRLLSKLRRWQRLVPWQTHDLAQNLIRSLNAQVERVVISELKDDTFYAVLWLTQGGETLTVDARPSDAIALALRADCPIYVAESVLSVARLNASGAPDNATTEQLREVARGMAKRRGSWALQDVICRFPGFLVVPVCAHFSKKKCVVGNRFIKRRLQGILRARVSDWHKRYRISVIGHEHIFAPLFCNAPSALLWRYPRLAGDRPG